LIIEYCLMAVTRLLVIGLLSATCVSSASFARPRLAGAARAPAAPWARARAAVAMAAPPPPPPPDEANLPTWVRRFFTPVVDDPGLPIADSLVCLAVPVLLATVILAGGLPRPSWLVAAPWVPRVRALPYVLPAIGHGLSLASCWVAGAFAAESYRKEAYGSTGSTADVLKATWAAGAFASGLLIVALQAQLVAQFGPAVQGSFAEVGFPSTAADFTVVQRTAELALDIGSEAVVMTGWRLYRSTLFNRFGD
jgi:hypothetical protein